MAKEERQKVVALKYDPARQTAPRVVARGQGELAERILQVAREKKIPLYKDPELIDVLSKLDVGLEIQPELYQAVAEVLIFIYKMNQKKLAQARKAGAGVMPGVNLSARR